MIDGNGTRNVVWFRPDGQEMDAGSWSDPNAKVVGLLLSDPKTRLLILANSYHEPIAFKLPPAGHRLASGSCASIPRPARSIRRTAASTAGQAVELPGRAAFFLAGTPA